MKESEVLKRRAPNTVMQLTGTIAACASALAQVPAADYHVKRKRDQQLRYRERRNGLADSGQPGCGAELSEEHRSLEAVSRDSHDRRSRDRLGLPR